MAALGVVSPAVEEKASAYGLSALGIAGDTLVIGLPLCPARVLVALDA
jgi:hypothetical protein